MKKFIVFVCFFTISLNAGSYNKFYYNLKHKNYEKACNVGREIVFNNKVDERLTSLIAKACLKADFIDTLGVIQSKLRKTKTARTNSVVLASVVLQKRLIVQFMYDDTDISSFSLPVIDHPLSHTFIAIRDKNYKLISKTPKIIEFEQNTKKYKVYIDYNSNGRVIIEVKDKDKTTIHRYL